VIELRNGRVSLALHRLEEGDGLPLLLLHELGSHAGLWAAHHRSWPGPVYGLDFAGHGASGAVAGGGYYAELYASDADLALEAIGDRAAVVGSGLGAYVATLLAGGRPEAVRAALLLPGRGLAGAASVPDPTQRPIGLEERRRRIAEAAATHAPGTDPWVWSCEVELRPTEYVADIAAGARCLLFSGGVSVDDVPRDGLGWWRAARERTGGETAPSAAETALAVLRERCD